MNFPSKPTHVPREEQVIAFHAPYRILVIDDDHDTAQSMRLLLKLLGSDVRVAFDGWSALDVAAEFRPEIVLMDIGMPELDGHHVARRLRHREWARDLVLVAVSGWCRDEDRGRAAEAGFDGYMTKPVNIDDLRKTLEALMVEHSSSAERRGV